MRTTGITRRIDELGRVVIPKEIRRTMRLKEGEQMEIFVEEDKLILQKYSEVSNLKTYADEVADSLAKSTNGTALVCDTDVVVAAAGENRRDYAGKTLLKQIPKLFFERTSRTLMQEDTVAVTGDDVNSYKMQLFAPITVAGDILGGIALLLDSDDGVNTKLKLTELSAEILGNIIQ